MSQRLHGRLPRAGAQARGRKDGQGDRRGGSQRAHRSAATRTTQVNERFGDEHLRGGDGASFSRSRESFRRRSRRRTAGSSRASSRSRWTRCAVLRRIPWWTISPEASGRRVALCRLLIQEPDILLLDEPTNHLDAETVQWLEQHLQRYEGTVIAVTHDRYFLDNVAGWILELDRGQGIPFEGNYSSWLEQKRERLAQEEKTESKRQKTLEHELEWIRMSPRARHAKSKARIARYDELLSAGAARRWRTTSRSTSRPGPRLGDVVLEAEHVSKGYEDRLLIDDLDLQAPAGRDRGHHRRRTGRARRRSLRMIVGQERPDSGTLRLGDTVKLGYVDQDRALAARQERLGGHLGRTGSDPPRQARGRLARLRGAVQLQRVGPAKDASRTCPEASATGCTSLAC